MDIVQGLFHLPQIDAYSSDGERAFHLIVNGHVMRAAGVGVLR